VSTRRTIKVAGEGRQLALPGTLWPAGVARARGNPLFFEEIRPDQANELIEEWGHPLGPCNRPYLSRAWGLAIDGQAAAVAMSASTVGGRPPGTSGPRSSSWPASPGTRATGGSCG
jgi:hypothetical protein